MRVALLGHTGLLGSTLQTELEKRGHIVEGYSGSTGHQIRPYRLDPVGRAFRESIEKKSTAKDYLPHQLAYAIVESRPDWILNCMVEKHDEKLMDAVNRHLPWWLADLSHHCMVKNWYITTPAADGLKNKYAMSKNLGERRDNHTTLIRTSFVGFSRDKKQLADWALGNIRNNHMPQLYDAVYVSFLTARQVASVLIDLELLHLRGCEIPVCCHQSFSKADFYEALAKELGMPSYGRKVKEPQHNEMMSASLVEALLGRKMPMLKDVITDLVLDARERGLV